MKVSREFFVRFVMGAFNAMCAEASISRWSDALSQRKNMTSLS